eukprot:Pgem_evm1s20222
MFLSCDDVEAVNYLNHSTKMGDGPLSCAVMNQCYSTSQIIIQKMLELGLVSVPIGSVNQFSSLQYAINGNDIVFVELVLKAFPSALCSFTSNHTNKNIKDMMRDPLVLAIKNCNAKILSLLLKSANWDYDYLLKCSIVALEETVNPSASILSLLLQSGNPWTIRSCWENYKFNPRQYNNKKGLGSFITRLFQFGPSIINVFFSSAKSENNFHIPKETLIELVQSGTYVKLQYVNFSFCLGNMDSCPHYLLEESHYGKREHGSVTPNFPANLCLRVLDKISIYRILSLPKLKIPMDQNLSYLFGILESDGKSDMIEVLLLRFRGTFKFDFTINDINVIDYLLQSSKEDTLCEMIKNNNKSLNSDIDAVYELLDKVSYNGSAKLTNLLLNEFHIKPSILKSARLTAREQKHYEVVSTIDEFCEKTYGNEN